MSTAGSPTVLSDGSLEDDENSTQAGEGARPTRAGPDIHVRDIQLLDVQVLHIQGIVFDEFAPSFDVFTHQRAEDDFAFGDIFEFH
jgi:hypothetical protein